MKEELKEQAISSQVLKRLVDNAPEVIYSASFAEKLKIEYIGKKILALTGHSAEDILTGKIDNYYCVIVDPFE